MHPTRLLDARGNPVRLAEELGRGGEGVVFGVAGQPEVVAKLYLKPPPAQHAAKLSAMAGMASQALLRVAAWPTGTLHGLAGEMVGFTMPRVSGRQPIFKLYGPKQRLREFPKADWRFLVHAASNAARAFATVHGSGDLVVGDVNHGNLVVGQDATVQMIDCDSFQVSQAGHTWFCTVGVGTHQPPEMQGRQSYAGVLRTPGHDDFGLAVIVFQLLCMARHPFAGRHLGAGEPPSIEEAIAGSRYAYARDQARTRMAPPPGSLPVDALTPELRDLFEAAFAPTAHRDGRPPAGRWVAALDRLAAALGPCRAHAAHFHRRGLAGCPWCAIEGASGVSLFPVVFVPAGGGNVMAVLWQELRAVAEPPPLGALPAPAPAAAPSPAARLAVSDARPLRVAAGVSVAAALAVALQVAPAQTRALLVPAIGVAAFLICWHTRKAGPPVFDQRLQAAERDWTDLTVSWAASQADRAEANLRAELSRLKAEHDALPAERHRRMQLVHDQRQERQLTEYLGRFAIADAGIPGIGAARATLLASHGIDTAGDITVASVLAVPSFGQASLAKLLAWRRAHESNFRFDPSRDSPASDLALVERDIAVLRGGLEQRVATGLARLKAETATLAVRRQALRDRSVQLAASYAQALADVAAVPRDRTRNVRLLRASGLAAGIAVLAALSTPLPVGTRATAAPQRSVAAEAGRVIFKSAANIRASASPVAAVIGQVPPGNVLRVFARKAGWLQVGDEQPLGWVFSGLVSAAP